MSLIDCPQCQKEVSEWARACPHCGRRVPAAARPQGQTGGQATDLDDVLRRLSAVRERLSQTPHGATEERARLNTELQDLRARAAQIRAPETSPRQRSAAESIRARQEEKRQQRRRASAVTFGLIAVLGIIALARAQSGDPAMAIILVVGMGLAIALWLYFLPTSIAGRREATNRGGVAAVNILLGWTVIGWIIALSMALSSETRLQRAIRTPAGLPAQPSSHLRVGRMAVVAQAPSTPAWSMPPSAGRRPTVHLADGLVVRVVARFGGFVKVKVPGNRSFWVDAVSVRLP